MNYIWCENYPIAIHITEGEYTPKQLQSIANHEQLVVRDMRTVNQNDKPHPYRWDYHPENA